MLFAVKDCYIMENKGSKDGVQEEILIDWTACEGTELTENEAKDIEEFFDIVLNDETYFDETDAWAMEVMLFQVFLPDELKCLFK